MKTLQLIYLFFFVFPFFINAQSNLQFTSLCENLNAEVAAECEEIEINLTMLVSTDCDLGGFLIKTITIDYFSDGFIDGVISGSNENYMFGLGEHIVEYAVGDQCGTTISCTRTIFVNDVTPPNINCTSVFRNLNQNNPVVTVLVEDVVFFQNDDCTQVYELDLSFSSDTLISKLQFDCYDTPIPLNQTYTVYATDASGNMSTCEFNLNLSTDITFCNTVLFDSILICVTTPNQDYLPNVLINDFPLLPSPTSDCDFFNPVNNFSVIRPEKNTAFRNGVDLLDFILINEHINGVQLFNDHHKMIAADLTSSLGHIAYTDWSRHRRFLLKLTDNFGSITPSWRFVLEDEVFVTPNYLSNFSSILPVADPFPIPLKYVGVKIGDINFSADPTEQTMGTQSPIVGALNLCADDALINKDEDFYIYLTSNNFNEMRGLQFSIAFDTNQLFFHQIIRNSLDKIESGNLNLEFEDQGKLGLLWTPDDGYPFTLAPGDSLCRIHFTALENIQLNDVFTINNVLIEKDAYSTSGRLEVDFQFCNTVNLEEISETDLEVTVVPNPFDEFTKIQFKLNESEQVRWTVFDFSGKEIYSGKENLPLGIHSFRIEKNDLPANGIYFFQIEIDGYIHLGKLLFQN